MKNACRFLYLMSQKPWGIFLVEIFRIRCVGKRAILVVNRPKMNWKQAKSKPSVRLKCLLLFLNRIECQPRPLRSALLPWYHESSCTCHRISSKKAKHILIHVYNPEISYFFCFPACSRNLNVQIIAYISRSTAPIYKSSTLMRSPCWCGHFNMFSVE